MSRARDRFIEIIERGHILKENTSEAMKVLAISPDRQSWQRFIDQLLVWTGSLCLAFSGLFFIAYNWDDIGYFGKFALVEIAMVAAIVNYWKIGADSVSGKASLLVAVIVLGVLLALYGQTYQTGADPWVLFFNWALLMLPWAIISRASMIWIFWLLLLNLSIILYHQAFSGPLSVLLSGDVSLLWILFIFNTMVLLAWQLLSQVFSWLNQIWATRLIATGVGTTISWLVLFSIFNFDKTGVWPVLIWVLWLTVMYRFFRFKHPDLFILAGCCLSIIIVATAFQAKHLISEAYYEFALLYLSFFITALGSGAAIWLRKIHQETGK